MNTKIQKKKRNKISGKQIDEKYIAEQNYSDKGINTGEDPTRNIPEYYEEEGINSKEESDESKRELKGNS